MPATTGGGASAIGDLTDVGTATATSGNILVADGDSWESVAVSGDATLANTGALTVTNVPISAINLDGGTDIGADLADADLILVDDGAGGTNRKCAMSRVRTYVQLADVAGAANGDSLGRSPGHAGAGGDVACGRCDGSWGERRNKRGGQCVEPCGGDGWAVDECE
jgi:hypothetical protein